MKHRSLIFLHISLVKDVHADVPEIPELEVTDPSTVTTRELSERHQLRMDFWSNVYYIFEYY